MCGHHRQHRHHDRYRSSTVPRSTVPADDLRASDAERDEVVSALRTHAGDGRLTVEELSERIDRVHAARTRRELAAIVADLPRAPRPKASPREARAEFADHLRSYLMVMALLVAIWAVTGMGYFWPIWPALGWGLAIVSHASAVRRPRTRT
jgi:hypothetical protein